jgi:hypothetical protein
MSDPPDDQPKELRRPGSKPLSVELIGRTTATECSKEKQREYDIPSRIACWTMITGIGTVIAALLAIVAAFIFWRQLGTMQAQLDSQEADFRIDQRPILSITRADRDSDHVDGPQYDAASKSLTWNYTIRNYGKGSAVDAKTCGYMRILGGQFVAENKGVGLITGQLVPTQTYWGTVRYGAEINSDAADKIEKTSGAVMIRLVLIYKDAYGTRYVVPNCLSRNENNSTNWNNCTGPISKVSIDTDVCEKTDNQ